MIEIKICDLIKEKEVSSSTIMPTGAYSVENIFETERRGVSEDWSIVSGLISSSVVLWISLGFFLFLFFGLSMLS